VREAGRRRRALVDRAVVGEGRGRGDVVDDDVGRVGAGAVVLVDDPRPHRVGAVVVEGALVAVAGVGGRVVGRAAEGGAVAVVLVAEIGRGVGRDRVKIVREAGGGRLALVDRAVAGQGRGRGDLVVDDGGLVGGCAVVLVDDPRPHRVGAVVVEGALVAVAGVGGRVVGRAAEGGAVAVVLVAEAGGQIGRASGREGVEVGGRRGTIVRRSIGWSRRV